MDGRRYISVALGLVDGDHVMLVRGASPEEVEEIKAWLQSARRDAAGVAVLPVHPQAPGTVHHGRRVNGRALPSFELEPASVIGEDYA